MKSNVPQQFILSSLLLAETQLSDTGGSTYDVRRTAHGTELFRISFVTAQTYLTYKHNR